jgi:hypothetical protein
VNKWNGNLDNKLWTRHCLGFIVEIIKAILKKKYLNSRSLHASYTFCMTKKDFFFISSWVDAGQLLVAARQTVQCINNRVFVIKLSKMAIFTNVELTEMGVAYGASGGKAAQVQILCREKFLDRVVSDSKMCNGATIERHR